MPTEVVVDASAAAKLLRPETETLAFRQWLVEARARKVRLVVPEVFPFEIRNVAAKALAAGELKDAVEAAQGCEDVLSFMSLTETPAAANIQLAARQALTTHDAAYVLLASAGRALVTYDTKMAKAAKSTAGCGPVLTPI